MPFFQPAYASPEAAFLHLLSELDQTPHQKSPCAGRQQCAPRQRPAEAFTPRFDVTETAEAYELFGELPGLTQSDLSIEFSDAQTLVIKGKTSRALPTQATASSAKEQDEATTTEDNKGKERDTSSDTASLKSHAPTVEDDYDDVDAPVTTPSTASSSASTTTATATATAEDHQVAAAIEASTPKPKYWVAERKVGEFTRSFSFSARIEQDFVSADLKNGVLHVVVPKSLKSRKVEVVVN